MEAKKPSISIKDSLAKLNLNEKLINVDLDIDNIITSLKIKEGDGQCAFYLRIKDKEACRLYIGDTEAFYRGICNTLETDSVLAAYIISAVGYILSQNPDTFHLFLSQINEKIINEN